MNCLLYNIWQCYNNIHINYTFTLQIIARDYKLYYIHIMYLVFVYVSLNKCEEATNIIIAKFGTYMRENILNYMIWMRHMVFFISFYLALRKTHIK